MVHILKKAIILGLALSFAVCSHLRPRCDFTVEGRTIDVGCSIAAGKMAQKAALAAAEEILPGKAVLPAAQRQLRFSLRPGEDTAPRLCDALLCACPGIISGDKVEIDGIPLGTVADARELRRTMYKYIDNTLPTWASTGSIKGRLSFKSHYTRADFEVSPEDMLMLITGMSPVMYSDGEGRVSPV